LKSNIVLKRSEKIIVKPKTNTLLASIALSLKKVCKNTKQFNFSAYVFAANLTQMFREKIGLTGKF